ncbi:30S ribosomal protein S8 [Candidatus Saccharibacteria bacterium]|nr:30S ribosomal protein S8 [Candidatus Saccharibacteria bacterium]MCL1962675.1 30S ribosomal protein S8 [Candidatus Saccharibacteria bacterium]
MSLQSTDPIADLLTRIRNAIAVGKNEVRLPSSKMKLTIAKELVKNGYLADVKTEKKSPRDELIVLINKEGESPVITEIDRVSKPGRRVYAGVSEIPKVKSGRGVMIVSTSKGIMTGTEAIKNRLGGELICKVY